MWRAALIVILLGLGTLLIGCQTMTETPDQTRQRYSRISDLNRLMLYEDFESFWLMDRPSNLTRWQVPVETIK